MIIVSGANGQLGRLVVDRLLERVPAAEVGVSVRDPQRAGDLAERGVRVRRGDFDDPATLAYAFEGASRVLVVSVDRIGEPAVRAHRAAIGAAVAAGAGRVLYTSHMGSSPDSAFPPMVDHAATEAVLAGCGVAWTSLRNGFYATSALQQLGAAVETGELVAPADGPVAWTTHADLAEAAAIALTGDDLDGITPPLTGAETLDLAAVAALAAELSGRSVRRVVVAEDVHRAGLVGHGLPAAVADMLIGMFRAGRRGDFGPADPTLATLLGRPPIPLRDLLATAVPTR